MNRFRAWLAVDIPRSPYVAFRIAFAAIWLVYDILDLKLGGTRGYLWGAWDGNYEIAITGLQYILIVSEIWLIVGFFPRYFAFAAFFARAFETRLFSMNDFLYCTVALLILTQCDSKRAPGKMAAAWPRDVFILQTAWIYLASAILKLNPPFLSGGDLYTRQNYTAEALNWYYPGFYRTFISTLTGNAVLAWGAVFAEAALGCVLVAWWYLPAKRKPLRRAAIVLVVGIHGFAMAALNVFFFGASMIAQVCLLTWEPADRAGHHTIPS